MNTDELEWALMKAERRVLEIQTKLHRWAVDDSHRRFDDLFNLVADPAFLLVAWDRVRGNKGARTAGVDGKTARSIEAGQGVEMFLGRLRTQIRDRSFRPVPVRERMIPKANGKLRRLGIPTVADRVVQASLKLVLEPVFEAEFLPCSYGFRPNRRAHDAIAETRYLASHGYEWVVEGDITACFDEISHPALMERVRNRIGDKRVLSLVKAFLKSGSCPGTEPSRTHALGPRRAGSCRRCWPTSRSRSWTSTSPRPPEEQIAPPRIGAGDGAGDCPTTGWSGMRMTSSCLSSGAVSTPGNYATRSRRR